MIRNLKVLVAAALALAAVGALSVPAAQAEPAKAKFHCAVAPCAITLAPDTSLTDPTTTHHVFVVKNSIGESVSFTCDQLHGYATSSIATPTALLVTSLDYTTCKANGQATVVRTNGCTYEIKAAGTVTIGCEAGKAIEVEITGTGCIATVAAQGPLTGISFANRGTKGQNPATTDVTVKAKVPGIKTTLDNAAGGKCLLDETKTPITAEYTTGNTIAVGFNDPAGTPADKHGGTKVDVWWTTLGV